MAESINHRNPIVIFLFPIVILGVYLIKQQNHQG